MTARSETAECRGIRALHTQLLYDRNNFNRFEAINIKFMMQIMKWDKNAFPILTETAAIAYKFPPSPRHPIDRANAIRFRSLSARAMLEVTCFSKAHKSSVPIAKRGNEAILRADSSRFACIRSSPEKQFEFFHASTFTLFATIRCVRFSRDKLRAISGLWLSEVIVFV